LAAIEVAIHVTDLEVKFEAFKLEHDKLCDEKELKLSFLKKRIVLLEQDVLMQKAEAEKARNAKVMSSSLIAVGKAHA